MIDFHLELVDGRVEVSALVILETNDRTDFYMVDADHAESFGAHFRAMGGMDAE